MSSSRIDAHLTLDTTEAEAKLTDLERRIAAAQHAYMQLMADNPPMGAFALGAIAAAGATRRVSRRELLTAFLASKTRTDKTR